MEIFIITVMILSASFAILAIYCSLVVGRLSDEEAEKYLQEAQENIDNDI